VEIYFSAGNSGRQGAEQILGTQVNIMPSYIYCVKQGKPNARLRRLGKECRSRKARRRGDVGSE
jgi:hypothetical protein